MHKSYRYHIYAEKDLRVRQNYFRLMKFDINLKPIENYSIFNIMNQLSYIVYILQYVVEPLPRCLKILT